MRSLSIRLALPVVSIWMGCGLSAWGMDIRYGETVYLFPTTTTVSVPTTYVATSTVVPSSYLLPAALVVPSYYPTAYIANDVVLAPTTYVETQYRQSLIGRLFGRGPARRAVGDRRPIPPMSRQFLPRRFILRQPMFILQQPIR